MTPEGITYPEPPTDPPAPKPITGQRGAAATAMRNALAHLRAVVGPEEDYGPNLQYVAECLADVNNVRDLHALAEATAVVCAMRASLEALNRELTELAAVIR